MKITGSKSYIKVEFDGKIVKIKGEMVVDGFVAFIETIKKWEPPYDTISIDEKTKVEIIKGVEEECKDRAFKIIFK